MLAWLYLNVYIAGRPFNGFTETAYASERSLFSRYSKDLRAEEKLHLATKGFNHERTAVETLRKWNRYLNNCGLSEVDTVGTGLPGGLGWSQKLHTQASVVSSRATAKNFLGHDWVRSREDGRGDAWAVERVSNGGLPEVNRVGTRCRDDRDFVQSSFRTIERESWTTVTDATVGAQTAAEMTGSHAEDSGEAGPSMPAFRAAAFRDFAAAGLLLLTLSPRVFDTTGFSQGKPTT